MWNALRPAVRPAAFALSLGIFRASSSSTTTGSSCTRWLVRQPSRMATRESPTPLVMLRTPSITWAGAAAGSAEETVDGGSEDVWSSWADMFAQRGYTTVEVDITASEVTDGESDITGAIKAASSELNDQIRLLAIPFAPVVIASGPGCLVAQAYVSDYPASGLVLVSPPPDDDPRADQEWKWPTFGFEPRFPICIVAPPGGIDAAKESRLGKAEALGVGRGGKGVSVIQGYGVRSEKTRLVSGMQRAGCSGLMAGSGAVDGQERVLATMYVYATNWSSVSIAVVRRHKQLTMARGELRFLGVSACTHLGAHCVEQRAVSEVWVAGEGADKRLGK